MNKKILIGSIIAVAILVLVSFTGVVGYQTTKSSTIAKASPLFTVRSSRAINEESEDFTCDYFGKGEEITISLPTYNSRNKQLQKGIDVISKMDDIIFKGFLNLVIKQIQKDNAQEDVNINEILYTFYQIRNNPDRIILDYPDSDTAHTICEGWVKSACLEPSPGCFWLLSLLKIICILLSLLLGNSITCEWGDCSTVKF